MIKARPFKSFKVSFKGSVKGAFKCSFKGFLMGSFKGSFQGSFKALGSRYGNPFPEGTTRIGPLPGLPVGVFSFILGLRFLMALNPKPNTRKVALFIPRVLGIRA